jgi:Sigma-70 region 2
VPAEPLRDGPAQHRAEQRGEPQILERGAQGTPDRRCAEDVLQETMMAAWRGIDRFEGHGSLRAWLYRNANPRRTNRPLTAVATRLTLIHEEGRTGRRPRVLTDER